MGKIIKKNANYKSVGTNGKTSDNKTFDEILLLVLDFKSLII